MLIQYEVRWVEDRDGHYTQYERGLLAAKDWNEAVERLKEYYDDDKIYWFSFCEQVEIINEEDVKEIFK